MLTVFVASYDTKRSGLQYIGPYNLAGLVSNIQRTILPMTRPNISK